MATLELGRESPPLLDEHMTYEILSRVDGITLATAGILSPEFHSISRDEALWENLCKSRWPSTKDLQAVSIVNSTGGFRRLFTQCYPLIHIKNPTFQALNPTSKDASEWLNEEEGEEDEDEDDADDEFSAIYVNDLVSLVDVIFNNRKVFSKVIQHNAENSHRLFSNNPFRINLLNFSDDDDEEVSEPAVEQMPIIEEREIRIEGKFWKEFLSSVRLSWILVNRKTQKMANLASWRPVGGERKWPYHDVDSDYIVRFGTILPVLPSHRLVAVHCNIAMKCKVAAGNRAARLKLAELSLQLEDMAGRCLRTKQSLLVLMGALSCTARSSNGDAIFHSYHQFTQAQKGRRVENDLIRSSGEKNLVYYLSMAFGFVAAFIYLSITITCFSELWTFPTSEKL